MNNSTIFISCFSVYHSDKNHERAVIVMIDFSPLWLTMEQKGISQYKLLKSGIDNKTLDTLKKNHNITLLTLEKLCHILDCTPNDVVRFIDEE